MPPPVPPSVNAGRTMAGRPMVVERHVGRCVARACVVPSTMTLGAYGWSIRSSRSRNASRSSAIRIASSGVPRRRIGVAVEDARLGHRGRQVERGLAAQPGEQALGLLLGDDRLDRLDRQRLEVDDVGDRGVGHDRRRVRVDEDRPDALGAERAAGLRPGVVELGRLADDDRARAQDQDRGRLGAGSRQRTAPLGRRSLPPRTGRRPPARRAVRARPRGGTGPSRSASRGGAAPRPSRR